MGLNYDFCKEPVFEYIMPVRSRSVPFRQQSREKVVLLCAWLKDPSTRTPQSPKEIPKLGFQGANSLGFAQFSAHVPLPKNSPEQGLANWPTAKIYKTLSMVLEFLKSS